MNFLFCCWSAQVILSCKIYAILVVSSLIKSRSYIARLFLWMLQITHCIHILPLLSIPRSLLAKDIGKEFLGFISLCSFLRKDKFNISYP